MATLSERAEVIARVIVEKTLGVKVERFDHNGRQRAVDFTFVSPNLEGKLEVTLAGEEKSFEFDAHCQKDGHLWESESSWRYSPPTNYDFQGIKYSVLKRQVQQICRELDAHGLDTPRELIAKHKNLTPVEYTFLHRLELRRSCERGAGVHIYPPTIAGFIEADNDDINRLAGSLLEIPHVQAHCHKLSSSQLPGENHLFLVVTPERLPLRFFTNDFPSPLTAIKLPDGVDTLWIWSPFWQECLVCNASGWSWNRWSTA